MISASHKNNAGQKSVANIVSSTGGNSFLKFNNYVVNNNSNNQLNSNLSGNDNSTSQISTLRSPGGHTLNRE